MGSTWRGDGEKNRKNFQFAWEVKAETEPPAAVPTWAKKAKS